MRIKEGYLLRQIAGTAVVVPVGDVDFNGMLTLNETGSFLWTQLQRDVTEDALVDALLEEYEVTKEAARTDTAAFLSKLREVGLLEE